jgi:hypothetical protein
MNTSVHIYRVVIALQRGKRCGAAIGRYHIQRVRRYISQKCNVESKLPHIHISVMKPKFLSPDSLKGYRIVFWVDEFVLIISYDVTELKTRNILYKPYFTKILAQYYTVC